MCIRKIYLNYILLGMELMFVEKIVDIKVCVIMGKLELCFCDMEIDI